jgi:translation initiation factor 2 gamma subunit (eIF-2gamma)
MCVLLRRSDAIAIIQNADYKYPTWPHIAEAKEDMVQAIKSAPTIDAAPVVRGEWEVAIGYDPNKKVQCQNCYKMAYEPTPYCPNCGAKMEDKP